MEVAGANRRWRGQFRYRGSLRESAVAQLFSLGDFTFMKTYRVLAILWVLLCSNAIFEVLWSLQHALTNPRMTPGCALIPASRCTLPRPTPRGSTKWKSGSAC